MKWLFCWIGTLASEVRTSNFYDVEDDRFIAVLDVRNHVLVLLLPSCTPELVVDGTTICSKHATCSTKCEEKEQRCH
jgi:hypothetical protein